MKYFQRFRCTLGNVLAALTLTSLAAGAGAAASPIDERELVDSGFKVLVATTKVQRDWVQRLPPGKIRAMQRTGKKYFIYPDSARNQIYVGGPMEYESYARLHPEHRIADLQQAAKEQSAYRGKQADAMEKASARDLSNPFLGATWADLGW